jgi:5-hydroxyisourate hydrolase-like protein (transthyretin family)
MKTLPLLLTLLLLPGIVYAACGPELVINGGFDGSAANWTDYNGQPIPGPGNFTYEDGHLRYNANGVSAWDNTYQGQGCGAPLPDLPAGNYTISIDAYGTGAFDIYLGNTAFFTIGPGDFSYITVQINVTDQPFDDAVHHYLFAGYYDGGGCGIGVEPIYGSPSNFIHDNISVKAGVCLDTLPTFNVTVYDLNHTLLNETVFTVMTDGPDFTLLNTTTLGRLNLPDLPPGNYSVKIWNENYTMVTFQFPAALNTNYLLDAYMTYNNATVTFHIVDTDDLSPLENVEVTSYRDIAGNLTLVEKKLTDFTGYTQFNYATGTKYSFTFTAAGYQTITKILNPILLSSYTVKMTKSSAFNVAPDFYGVTISYAPKRFRVGDVSTLNSTIKSPYGYLNSYSTSITYPGHSGSDTGATSTGETLTNTYNLSGITPGSWFTVTNTYHTNLSGTRTFTDQYRIEANNATTIEGLKDTTFGLGILDRLFIATCMIGVIAGVAGMILGALPAILVAILFMGFFTYIGFIPVWGASISVIIGFLLLARKGGD